MITTSAQSLCQCRFPSGKPSIYIYITFSILISLSIYLSLTLSIPLLLTLTHTLLPISIFLSLTVCLNLSLTFSASLSPSLNLTIILPPFHLFISRSKYIYVCLSLSPYFLPISLTHSLSLSVSFPPMLFYTLSAFTSLSFHRRPVGMRFYDIHSSPSFYINTYLCHTHTHIHIHQ